VLIFSKDNIKYATHQLQETNSDDNQRDLQPRATQMKRRNFLLSGSALVVISLGITATAADVADSVTASSDFRALITDVSTDLTATPNAADELSEHYWELQNAYIEEDINAVVVSYPESTSFDAVSTEGGDDDVEIVFERREDNFREMDIEADDYSGNEARFVITDSQPNLVDEAQITIQNVENPEPGTYTPEISFETDNDVFTTDAELGISSDDAFFSVEIDDYDDVVDEGETVTVNYTVTNVDGGIGTQDIVFSVDGTKEDRDENVSLEVDESESGEFTYSTDENDGSTIEVTVESDDTDQSRTVGISGWNLDVEPPDQNTEATHTWSNGFADFDGEIAEIIVEYFPDNQPVEFDEVDLDSITVELTREGDDEPEPVTVVDFNTTIDQPSDESTLEIELDGGEDTSIEGEAKIEVENVENPNQEFEATITLSGDDETTSDRIEVEY